MDNSDTTSHTLRSHHTIRVSVQPSTAAANATLLDHITPALRQLHWLCQSVSALCSRSRGSYISRLVERLPRTSQTTVAFCRTLAVANCGSTPMTCGSCSCRQHITNSVAGVSRPPVLDRGTTFHLDYGGRDLPSTPSDNL